MINHIVVLERKCWSNEQYSRHECLETSGILSDTEADELEETVLKVFEKIDVDVNPENVNCLWLKTRNTSKKVISNYRKEKMSKNKKKKKKLLNLESMGISSPIFIFNQDPNKQAQDVIYSRKTKKANHHLSNFSKSTVSQTTSQKHLGVFDEHLISALRKTDKTIGLKLYNASFH